MANRLQINTTFQNTTLSALSLLICQEYKNELKKQTHLGNLIVYSLLKQIIPWTE